MRSAALARDSCLRPGHRRASSNPHACAPGCAPRGDTLTHRPSSSLTILLPQGFDQYGLGLHAALPTPQLQAALGLKAGLVSSGNSLDYVERDMEIMREHDTSVKVGGEKGRLGGVGGGAKRVC